MKYTYYNSTGKADFPESEVGISKDPESSGSDMQTVDASEKTSERSLSSEVEQHEKPVIQQSKGLFRSKVLLMLVLNTVIWGAAFIYLKYASPLYQTSWGVIVLGSEDSKADVQLPDAGRASATSSGSRTKSFEDARADYIYIAKSPEVIREAAEIAKVDEKRFGQPEITADEDSAVISFVQTAESPELVERQAFALYTALYDYLEELRQSALYQKQGQNNLLIQSTREQVQVAQSQLAAYQASSEFESDVQLDNLTAGIEELRRQRAELKAQATGLAQRAGALSQSNALGTENASDAYKLSGDDIFQNSLAEYGRLKTELSTLKANLSSQHPQIIEVTEELKNTQSFLKQRSQQLLGRPFSLDFLTQIESSVSDPKVQVLYSDVFRQAVESSADREQIDSQGVQLEREIESMQVRLDKLSQEKLVVDRLKRELQVAEAVLASKVAKLGLNEEDIYSIYPPIKLVVKPSVPNADSPISPNVRMVLITALAASFLATSGILLFWRNAYFEDKKSWMTDRLLEEKDALHEDGLLVE